MAWPNSSEAPQNMKKFWLIGLRKWIWLFIFIFPFQKILQYFVLRIFHLFLCFCTLIVFVIWTIIIFLHCNFIFVMCRCTLIPFFVILTRIMFSKKKFDINLRYFYPYKMWYGFQFLYSKQVKMYLSRLFCIWNQK